MSEKENIDIKLFLHLKHHLGTGTIEYIEKVRDNVEDDRA